MKRTPGTIQEDSVPQPLPTPASLEQLRKRAKELRRAHSAGDPQAVERVRTVAAAAPAPGKPLSLAQAHLVLAREYGFESWPKLKRHVERGSESAEGRAALLVEAALAGDLDTARAMLAAEPALAASSLAAACALGEAAAVEALLARDPSLARAKGGPRAWEPLLTLAYSRFLGDPSRAGGMLAAARALLARGADPNAFHLLPESRRTALYGAAGVNRHEGLTRLLLEAGADPSDREPERLGPESLYHACESPDLACLRAILEAGPKRHQVSFCLARKLDFEDFDGAKLMLDHGADPNFAAPGDGSTRLHHAVIRNRSLRILELLLDRGADPNARDARGLTPYAVAMQQGRDDAAALLRARGAGDDLSERDRFLHACSRGDEAAARAMLERRPELLSALSAKDREVFTDAAWHGRIEAVRAMLALGFEAGAVDCNAATPLHAASFKGELEIVRLLLARRAPLDLRDGCWNATPLEWAIAGTEKVDETNPNGNYVGVVEALLAAGAQPPQKPSGRADVREALKRHGAR